jgi:hypothetical protein
LFYLLVRFDEEQRRSAKAYAETLCVPSIDEAHASMQKEFMQLADITAFQGGKNPAQHEKIAYPP